MENNPQLIQLIMRLRGEGIRDQRVLAAIEKIPRALFVDPDYHSLAWENCALPIDCGQTVSQPFIVAYMTQEMELEPHMRVLEIGTGSGYQAVILSELCQWVYTIERHVPLLKAAQDRFKTLDISNIVTRKGDGARGWPEQAPFDRIIMTASAREIPDPLIEQLKPGGVMILPVGQDWESQYLIRVEKSDKGVRQTKLLPVRFVPLVTKQNNLGERIED